MRLVGFLVLIGICGTAFGQTPQKTIKAPVKPPVTWTFTQAQLDAHDQVVIAKYEKEEEANNRIERVTIKGRGTLECVVVRGSFIPLGWINTDLEKKEAETAKQSLLEEYKSHLNQLTPLQINNLAKNRLDKNNPKQEKK